MSTDQVHPVRDHRIAAVVAIVSGVASVVLAAGAIGFLSVGL